MRELLDGYFGTCREIVGRYGGTIEKFIGDAVMAVWGTPIAQEDDAERAVRAALDLVDAVRRLGEGADVPNLALRAGVLTGEAAVTLGASDMGMVAGDLVNTASRLQSVAQAGTVLVGDSTRRASGEAIAYEAVEDQVLKGKELPVAAWRALRVVAKRGGAGRSEQLEAPFVGRDAELQLIKDFYHGTARERGVRLVSVIGQGGIGKSRLAWEFLKYIDGVTEVVYWHQGRSPSYGDGITFWALGEMVRMRLGIGEGADEEATREALTASLDGVRPRRGGATHPRGSPAPAPRLRRRLRVRSAASCSPRGAPTSSESPSRGRWFSSSRTSSGPMRAWSTSSRTCWPGPAGGRSTSSRWRDPSCWTDARRGAPASVGSRRSASSR